jgi:two-component system, sporulation sensor kinase B
MHFLFNLSLLFILLFVCLIWSDRLGIRSISKPVAFASFFIAIIICFLVSYKLSDSVYLDLRDIPVILGGLYLELGPLLAIVTIFLRAFHGFNAGFWSNFILYAILAMVFGSLHLWFGNLTHRRRILFTIFISFVISFISMIGLEIISPTYNRFDVWLAYLCIPPLGTGLIAYAIEFVSKNLLLKRHLIKSKKLEAVEQMGAAISHEIRNPLTAAIGFVQLLQEDNIQKHKKREYLDIVKNELESAEKVIQDYLTFSKPALNSLEILNVKKELLHIIKIIQPIANRNSVEIVTQFSAIGFIEGDLHKFHQCFLNVMKNAIEAMPKGGILTIETEFSQYEVTVIIRDTGMGMNKEQLERLGEPYYSTKAQKGTGLGMMVVFSIVRAMKGSIQVKSEVGKGAAFLFSFPKILPSFKNERF